jgi:hypothetical protein
MNFTPPEPLASYHSITDFSCGITSLDDWLKRRAYANQASGATRTFVTCVDNRVVGYYALASGAISIQSANVDTPRSKETGILGSQRLLA